MRHRVEGSGWINLGLIIDSSAEQTIPCAKTAKLPNGVKAIRASILQLIPSTTILVCQFIFENDLANILEKPLRQTYKTYKKKNKHSYSFISVEHQKKDAINLHKEYLNNICSTWLKENFKGIFASDFIKEKHPVCSLLTLEKNLPFTDFNDSLHNYLSLLDISNSYDVFENEKLTGLYLKLPREKNSLRKNLILTGNINEILRNEDLEAYGRTKESSVLNFLHYLDDTLGIWVLNILLDAYIYKITDLRDSYGKTNINNINESVSIITELDYEVIRTQKNILPFLSEIRNYCKDKTYFMHELYEFQAINEKCKYKLFNSIRKQMLHKTKLLKQNIKTLKETATSARQINTIISSDLLAKTNIEMQKSMHKMTLIILFLTIISTVSAVVSIIGKDKVLEIKNEVISLYKYITSSRSQ